MSVPRLLAAVLAVVGVVLAALVVRIGAGPEGDSAPASGSAVPARPAASTARSAERRALRVLHAWDTQRSRAYRTGDGRRLRSLYVTGSTAGQADARLLAGYRSRGLTVAGLRTQVLALEVLSSGRNRLEVRVDDRVVGAVAVQGAQRVRLPRDAVSSRAVVLVRSGDGRWRVSAVRDATGSG